jgi:glycosyltransferase involved in cell wall biosynthesis
MSRLLQRHAHERIARGIKTGVRSAEALGSHLYCINGAGSLPPPLDFARARKISPAFFSPGDVCLSLSASWHFAGYGELIARHKASTQIHVVNLLYDLIPVLHPQWVSPGYARKLAIWARQQIANADLLLTISEFQKSEIAAYVQASGLPGRHLQVIRLGDAAARETATAPPRHVPSRPFVLCVSTVDARKNQSCLHEVWRRLAARLGPACPHLLLVGMVHDSGRGLLSRIRQDPLVRDLIVHVSDASDDELTWYVARCLFTIYPSMYEGWGLPVRESLAAGRYCIASQAASLREAGGSWADYFDPMSVEACLDLVERALSDPAYVAGKEHEIRRSFVPHTWQQTAQQISGIVDGVVSHAGKAASHVR